MSRRSAEGAKAETPGSKFAGGHRIRVTPVPIPNTEVKPDTADGTAWETVWESRSLPALFTQARCEKSPRVSFYLAGDYVPHSFPCAHGLCFLGRLAHSAAVWESRSLPALFTQARCEKSPRVSFYLAGDYVPHSFPCAHGLCFLGRLPDSAAVWESRSLPALFTQARSSKDGRAFFICRVQIAARDDD